MDPSVQNLLKNMGQANESVDITDLITRANDCKEKANESWKIYISYPKETVKKERSASLNEAVISWNEEKKALGILAKNCEKTPEQEQQMNDIKFRCYNNLGNACWVRKQYSRCISHCNKALKINPNNEKAALRLIKSLIYQKERDKASQIFDKFSIENRTDTGWEPLTQYFKGYDAVYKKRSKDMCGKMFQ